MKNLRARKLNIDWQQLALNLRNHRPLGSLSVENGWNKAYLGELARTEIREPKFSDGLVLLDLHLDMCGEEKHRRLLCR